MPRRFQYRPRLQLPPNTVYVGRPTRWGNPYTVRKWGLGKALEMFKAHIAKDFALQNLVRQELRGKNLACWCGLDKDCHADVLLKYANEEEK